MRGWGRGRWRRNLGSDVRLERLVLVKSGYCCHGIQSETSETEVLQLPSGTKFEFIQKIEFVEKLEFFEKLDFFENLDFFFLKIDSKVIIGQI